MVYHFVIKASCRVKWTDTFMLTGTHKTQSLTFPYAVTKACQCTPGGLEGDTPN